MLINTWLRFSILLLALRGSAAPIDDAFFRDRIEPILQQRCFECHSHTAGKMKGSLTLDSRSGWVNGGKSGAALVPGQPEASRLIQAIRRGDPDTAMPPKNPLSAGEIQLLEEWIRGGAPDPRIAVVSTLSSTDWWSLRPLRTGVVPKTAGRAHTHPIDGFLSVPANKSGLRPGRSATARTVLRRLYFDLHGLAPLPEELRAFQGEWDATPADSSDAREQHEQRVMERWADRLLAHPRYGERWARHWFDTIHFADTHGFEHDRIRQHAWRYRDYVIAAFNADIPWDRFVREQLAVDVFYPDQPQRTPALGFLGAGPYDQSAAGTAPMAFEVTDRDDLIVQTMAAFTSTTAGCARCHDHKFDPIPQRDYYALAAVFAGVGKGDIAFDSDPAVGRARARWQALAVAAEKTNRVVLESAEAAEITAAWMATQIEPAVWKILSPTEFTSAGGATLTPRDDGSVLSGGKRPEKETLTLFFKEAAPQLTAIRLEVLTDDSLPHRGPGRSDNGNLHLSEFELWLIDGKLDPRRIALRRAFSDFDQESWTISHSLDGSEGTAWGIHPRVGEAHRAVFVLTETLTVPATARLKVVVKQLHGRGHVIGRARIAVTTDDAERAVILPDAVVAALSIPEAQRNESQRLALATHAVRTRARVELSRLPPIQQVYAAGRDVSRHGERASVPTPREIRVLRRGELSLPGEIAQPGALECVTALPPRFAGEAMPEESQRRAALADWIASPDNPLTWRSIANRVWHYHFGRGLADSPNDLGRMGNPPTHPELLDWLAADFRDHGGSLKRLHRMIVTSATFRTAEATPPRRNRLDAESFRDTVLNCAGRLDSTMGGPAVMHFTLGPGIQVTPTVDYSAHDWDNPGAGRRSIYRMVYRNIEDPFMAALDFPDAAQLAPTRPFSTSPLQALALWNDDFVLRLSERFGGRLASMAADSADRVRAAVRLVWLRDPTGEELRDLTTYSTQHGLAALGRVLFNSDEFLFVD